MRAADDLAQPFRLKAIIVGDKKVGKTQLINRCTDGSFSESEDDTNTLGFHSLTINFDRKNISLQLWDSPGEHPHSTPRDIHYITSYIRGSNIVIIIINATDDHDTKSAKISNWITRIKENTDIMPAIVIVENKMDLPGAYTFADHDDMLSDMPYTLHLASSLKQENNFKLTLLNALKPIFTAILFTLNNPVALHAGNRLLAQSMPTIRTEAELNATKSNIRNLSEGQAKMILVSIETLLIQGPLNEINKRYNIFAGGKPLILKDGSTITVPEHVYDWLLEIVSASQFTSGHKRVLEEFYVKVNQAAETKPFSRNATTHDFYASLIGFIEHVVAGSLSAEIDYFSIRSKIDELSEEHINSILHELLERLEHGVINEPNRNPYDVGFWGGKKHTLSTGQSCVPINIKVPGHVSALIHIMNNNNPNESKKDKLINSLNFSFIAFYSTCSSRDQTTNNFYTILPGEFIGAINRYHAQRPGQSIQLL